MEPTLELTLPPKSAMDASLCFFRRLFFFSAITAAALAQNTIRVPADVSTIQGAISSANNGDTVLVSPGTYIESLNFLGKAITVTSTDGAASTIIDGSGSLCCVAAATFSNSEGPASVLNGFTVRNTQAPPPTTRAVYGIEIDGASPTITNNIITNNLVGGGI